MSIIDNLRAIRARMAKATNSVSDDIQGLRAQIAAKREELKRLSSTAAPRAEIEERVHDLVAKTGENWIAREGWSVIYHLGSPVRSAAAPWMAKNGSIPWEVQCAADPKAAADMLLGLVARIEYAEGPALADRPALIAKAEADLADLEAGEEELVDEACEAGLVIAHRPEVVTRRGNAARNAQLEAEKIADRAARQAALDQGHRARPRVGRSAYLS